MNKHHVKAEKVRQHLDSHPHDYKSVVALLKINSDAIALDIKHREDMERKEVAKHRREYEKRT